MIALPPPLNMAILQLFHWLANQRTSMPISPLPANKRSSSLVASTSVCPNTGNSNFDTGKRGDAAAQQDESKLRHSLRLFRFRPGLSTSIGSLAADLALRARLFNRQIGATTLRRSPWEYARKHLNQRDLPSTAECTTVFGSWRCYPGNLGYYPSSSLRHAHHVR